jgi:glycogen(starch) synthase
VRVLAITPVYIPWVGGLEIFVRQLLAEMGQRGYEFMVLTSHGPESESGFDDVDGVPVLRIPVHDVLARRDAAVLFRLQHEIARSTGDFNPDVVHAHDAGAVLWLYRRAARRDVRPVLITLHTVMRGRVNESLDVRAELLGKAEFITGVSRDVIDDALSYAPSIAGKSAVVANGVAPTVEKTTPVPTDPPRLVCMGRLVPEKGFDRAIAAFAHVAARIPEVRLAVAGDGPERQRLVALAADLGVADRVDFLGFLDRPGVARLLEQATAVVMPSRLEGLPLVALEAAWSGRPVVATRAPGLDHAVVDGETALVVDAEPEAFARGLERLLTEPDLAQRLGAGGRARAEREYSIGTCADAYDAIYRRMVGQHADRPQ